MGPFIQVVERTYKVKRWWWDRYHFLGVERPQWNKESGGPRWVKWVHSYPMAKVLLSPSIVLPKPMIKWMLHLWEDLEDGWSDLDEEYLRAYFGLALMCKV